TEINKSFLHFLDSSVNIEVIGIHGTDHGHIRVQLQKASVIFISFYHTYICFAAPKVCSIVYRYSSKEGITTIPTVSQQMSDHRRGSCFSMCTGNTDVKRTSGDHLQNIASLYDLVSILLIKNKLFMIHRYRGRIDN